MRSVAAGMRCLRRDRTAAAQDLSEVRAAVDHRLLHRHTGSERSAHPRPRSVHRSCRRGGRRRRCRRIIPSAAGTRAASAATGENFGHLNWITDESRDELFESQSKLLTLAIGS